MKVVVTKKFGVPEKIWGIIYSDTERNPELIFYWGNSFLPLAVPF